MAGRLRRPLRILLPAVGMLSGGVVASRFSPSCEVGCDGDARSGAAAGDAAQPDTLSTNLMKQLEGVRCACLYRLVWHALGTPWTDVLG